MKIYHSEVVSNLISMAYTISHKITIRALRVIIDPLRHVTRNLK